MPPMVTLAKGHEHFGYKDGISQPFVLGTEGWGKQSANDKGSEELPGQGAVPPGVILLGRPGDNEEAGIGEDPRIKPAMKRPPWAIDGNILAFRYLHQRVPEFNKFTEIKATPTVSAPIDIADRLDDRDLAKDPFRNNTFVFVDNDNIAENPHSRCPFAANIRKTNPRNDLPANTMRFERILRRGIPYGDEVGGTEKKDKDTTRDRGLLFACYQSHLNRGFGLMQQTWANNPNFIFRKEPNAGVDPIIGQMQASAVGNDARPRNASRITSLNPNTALFEMGGPEDEWVVSRGGEYLFAPSILTLERYLAAD